MKEIIYGLMITVTVMSAQILMLDIMVQESLKKKKVDK